MERKCCHCLHCLLIIFLISNSCLPPFYHIDTKPDNITTVVITSENHSSYTLYIWYKTEIVLYNLENNCHSQQISDYETNLLIKIKTPVVSTWLALIACSVGQFRCQETRKVNVNLGSQSHSLVFNLFRDLSASRLSQLLSVNAGDGLC